MASMWQRPTIRIVPAHPFLRGRNHFNEMNQMDLWQMKVLAWGLRIIYSIMPDIRILSYQPSTSLRRSWNRWRSPTWSPHHHGGPQTTVTFIDLLLQAIKMNRLEKDCALASKAIVMESSQAGLVLPTR